MCHYILLSLYFRLQIFVWRLTYCLALDANLVPSSALVRQYVQQLAHIVWYFLFRVSGQFSVRDFLRKVSKTFNRSGKVKRSHWQCEKARQFLKIMNDTTEFWKLWNQTILAKYKNSTYACWTFTGTLWASRRAFIQMPKILFCYVFSVFYSQTVMSILS